MYMSFYGVVVNSCLHTLFLFGYPFLPLFFSSPPSLPPSLPPLSLLFYCDCIFWKCSNWLTFSFLVVTGSAPFLCVHCFCLHIIIYPFIPSLPLSSSSLPFPLDYSLSLYIVLSQLQLPHQYQLVQQQDTTQKQVVITCTQLP